uniref:Uncharacterized protein n=1 Tax=Kalanchoe fedtschenkoi TaxID=63787 RepID=A0A7N0V2V2_KALFE
MASASSKALFLGLLCLALFFSASSADAAALAEAPTREWIVCKASCGEGAGGVAECAAACKAALFPLGGRCQRLSPEQPPLCCCIYH